MRPGAPTRAAGVAMLCATLLVPAGCSRPQAGPPRFAVRGQVTFDGKPVPAGRIAFEPVTVGGNVGPAGYGNIVAGLFTTYPGMGAVGGPHVVRISGLDGVPTGEMVEGKELFPEYTTKVELPTKETTIDFEVPRGPSKPPKASAPAGKPKR